jgi:hypothetical protein
MKILIVAFRFPPSNFIGAVRVGKLASFLHRNGHVVRVLTTDLSEDRSLPVEMPPEWIVNTGYNERPTSLGWALGCIRGVLSASQSQSPPSTGAVSSRSTWEKLRRQYYGLIHIPDRDVAWRETAVPAGEDLIKGWKPDIIFASAPPFTGLVVASRLSRTFGIPWVADFRDLWTDNPYYSFPAWRRPIDRWLERSTMRDVSAIVTTSPLFATRLRELHRKRVEVVFNGYAEEDFPSSFASADPNFLVIRYTGNIYRGFRDPSPLFAAMSMLERELRNHIRVEFFGDSAADIRTFAEKYGVADEILVRPSVPYRKALELQLGADVLLLLHWNDRRDAGTIPGKLFEYLYARRPILYIGYEDGTAAQIIRERGAGFISNSAESIGGQLRDWLHAKKKGSPTRLDASVSQGLSRDEQFCKLEPLFADILAKG